MTATAVGPPLSITVKLSGSNTTTAGVRYLSSYTPTVNDSVVVLRVGGDLLVLGKLA